MVVPHSCGQISEGITVELCTSSSADVLVVPTSSEYSLAKIVSRENHKVATPPRCGTRRPVRTAGRRASLDSHLAEHRRRHDHTDERSG